MTSPSERVPPADHGEIPRDLPPPPPLRFARIGAPPPSLFLDFDGTLVEIADHPDDVVVATTLPSLIARIADALDGRLALVTGRSIASLEALMGPLEVAVAGSHGGEFRPAGQHEALALAAPLPPLVVDRLATFAQDNGGLLVEPKPHSIAVHYRRHPEALAPLVACASALGEELGLALKHGKQVIELAMPGSDKGSAVTRFMETPPFAGSQALFVGDDVTDEDAFTAVIRLGGHGVLVGPMRATAATWRLDSVGAVHRWLEEALGATRQENVPA
ncbi:trehalose 6-phosphate phosphatase [Novosphingobium sp. PhB165]|uniref:trehalose-phosphatase n=1 Tax=Novosphingobium sp. PhB165 TaxID=2485105 RepID=UPI00104A3D00|nr:trehalose-phosphatase [Novosphingobium sp. PhB165]TCM17838.1 trehalose 6-phosphate phosphatase [Novosphingobium sp. PhB165]